MKLGMTLGVQSQGTEQWGYVLATVFLGDLDIHTHHRMRLTQAERPVLRHVLLKITVKCGLFMTEILYGV